MKSKIEKVKECQISRFIGKESEGKSAETWKVSIKGIKPQGYLKLCASNRQIIAELVASKLGRIAGLPIPTPMITTVKKGRLPPDSAWFGTGNQYGFISMSAGTNPISFQRLINTKRKDVLSKWDGLQETIIFDEWIANDDRNLENILYCLNSKKFWLIDHGEALKGEYAGLWPLDDPKVATNNILMNIWKGKKDQSQQYSLLEQNKSIMAKLGSGSIQNINNDGWISALESLDKVDEIINFLQQRIFLTSNLLCQKMGTAHLPINTQ